MIYVFIPYYNEDTPEFKKSLESQTVPYRLIKRNRKRDKIYWTKAVRDFQKEIKRFCGALDTDIVCIMNNDIEFPSDLFRTALDVRDGDVFVPDNCLVGIEWETKRFDSFWFNSFIGRCFFMTLGDFKKIKFSPLLPHYLSDIDFGYKCYKKGMTIWRMPYVTHKDHPRKEGKLFSILNDANPIFWTIFLLKHPNRYTFINILKSWYEVIRLFCKS